VNHRDNIEKEKDVMMRLQSPQTDVAELRRDGASELIREEVPERTRNENTLRLQELE